VKKELELLEAELLKVDVGRKHATSVDDNGNNGRN
jgi:hypothetical protein